MRRRVIRVRAVEPPRAYYALKFSMAPFGKHRYRAKDGTQKPDLWQLREVRLARCPARQQDSWRPLPCARARAPQSLVPATHGAHRLTAHTLAPRQYDANKRLHQHIENVRTGRIDTGDDLHEHVLAALVRRRSRRRVRGAGAGGSWQRACELAAPRDSCSGLATRAHGTSPWCWHCHRHRIQTVVHGRARATRSAWAAFG